ncbi:MAG: FRG domain-containing protein [Magnetospirillum sp.]|nr:FRG domain-containing protein [Magnetospirillum sp.]
MATHVHLEVHYKDDLFSGVAKSIRVYDSSKNTLVEPKEFLADRTDLVVASNIEIEGTWSENYFKGKYKTDISAGGTFTLSNPAKQLTEPPNHIFTWGEFYEFAAESIKRGGLVYRGQASNSWRLRSSFHRARRYDLLRYWSEVCIPMRDRLAAAGIEFDLNSPEEIGSMICFAQHHGFPYPIARLDIRSHGCSVFRFRPDSGSAVAKPILSHLCLRLRGMGGGYE